VVSTYGVSSPADLANLALTRMGYKMRVGSLYDGSDAAKKILDIYVQTRDEQLRVFDYDFAERTVALTLLKSAPVGGYFPPNTWNPTTNPPIGFAFEYAFPSDAVKIRTVKPSPLFLFNADPQPNAFQIANDNNYSPSQRVILCNVQNAMGVYTGQITDPTNWDVLFTEAFAAALSRRLAPGLVGMDGAKMASADEQMETQMSEMDSR